MFRQERTLGILDTLLRILCLEHVFAFRNEGKYTGVEFHHLAAPWQ